MASQGDSLGRGGLGPTPEPPFEPQSQTQLAGFKDSWINPAALVYIDLNDQLLITVYNQGTPPYLITVCGRLMRVDGRVIRFSFDVQAQANTYVWQVQQLAEGYLLDVCAFYQNGPGQRASDFIQVMLLRGGSADDNQTTLLVSGYMNGTTVIGWPWSALTDPTDGAGLLTMVNVPSPGAGNEWYYTTPATTRTKIRQIGFHLTTDAVAPFRRVKVLIFAGTDFLMIAPSTTAQAGSTNQWYNVGAYPFATPIAGEVDFIPMPPNVVVPQSTQIGTVTDNLDIGDQYAGIWLLTEQWIDGM